MCAKPYELLYIFNMQFGKKNGVEMGREIRYAQCHFVDMSALKRNMLEHVRFILNNFAKVTSSCAIKK